ncbi:TPR-like protein [Sodiomyces alkalinus F11]|uniref:TPR-like protein n=1 Tax=Sodiomyces alkalinus (strain CBS 110278 / VKM F-3762 / F11) TaxID=1314773 RepID=A0A3N2PN66_SODAK|nr:TPR-like protein [Sodiomyces alkalinus F11]ROT35933.1 TPR-like protein [Sodiomyces alkalinus F11]
MAPSSATITNLLRQVVYYHLDNNSYENALFFAEKLNAQDPRSSESAHLLALSHFRLGDIRSAFEISRPAATKGSNLGALWVYAQSSLRLERYREGISILEKTKDRWSGKSNLGRHSATNRSLSPDEPTVLCLLGKLYHAYDDHKRAIECFENALKLNPFMFDAFQALCNMGATVRVPNMFRVTDSLIHSFDHESAPPTDPREMPTANPLDLASKKSSARNVLDTSDPFELQRSSAHQEIPSSLTASSAESAENGFMSRITAARTRLASASVTSANGDGMETPPASASTADTHNSRSNFAAEAPQAPARRTRATQAVDPAFAAEPPPRMGPRAGTKRPAGSRSQEKESDQHTEALPDQNGGMWRPSAAASQRKRTVSGHPVQARQQSEEPGPQRRSARLNMFKPSVTKANSGAATIGTTATRELKKARPPISRAFRPGSSGSSVGRVVSGNRTSRLEDSGMDVDPAESTRPKDPPMVQQTFTKMPPPPEYESIKVEEALRWIMELLKKTASGYLACSQYRCKEAVQAFSTLPRSQQDTPWVLAQMGRAYYEQALYSEAEKFFCRLRAVAPTRLEDMEVYSTVLWHLKRETDLSFLAHELVDAAWTSPQAWCTLGNAWSLVRDPDQALRCFKRATQLNPKFAYAFTLQGHEHVANEEYEKALAAYRQAISADRRHYNAYYGMGKVHEKLGNYDKARIHFQAASTINPTNAVLICCIGNVLEKQKHLHAALQAFTRATELAPRAAQTRYKKARAHLAIGQLEAAQKELLILKDLAPDEANVHFLLGKMYIQTGEKQSAVRHFTIALALDPKASQQVKEAIESLEDDIDMDDSMMD